MHWKHPVRLILVSCVLGLAAGSASAASPLKPPPGYFATVGNSPGAYDCPAVPTPYTGTMDFPSKYQGSGKARDQVNPQAEEQYESQIKSMRTLEKGINEIVGKYMATGRPAALACALHWYSSWADAGALLGPATTYSGRAMRKWTLASLSGAWLHLEFSSSQPLADYPQQTRKIETWLGQVADKVESEWSLDAPRHKINNHYYWVGWSLMATGVVLDRRDLFDWGVSMYRIFASQDGPGGYLPNELKRDTRALGYHNFALTPLAMMAAFGKANGVDLADAGGGALKRLAGRVLQGLNDPAIFAAKTGYRQITKGFEPRHLHSKLAWLEPYCWTVGCSLALTHRMATLSPLVNSRLGGNMTATFSTD